MENRDGFTLIEVIGSIIILGILAIIAISLFTRELNEFRDEYYENLVSNLENSGREFFSDNRMYRPTGRLEAAKVSLNTLNSQKYIDEFIDYEGSECDKESYVIVIRKGKDEYDYHACLKCQNDDYDNTIGNKYCDPSWFDQTTLGYTLGDVEDIYIYKGTDKKVLEDKTRIPVWIVKYDSAGNPIESIDGTGTENVPEISPENLDIVDTNEVGEYIIEYKYDTTDGNGNPVSLEKYAKVIVYENEAPIISLTKTNNVKTGQSSSESRTTAYNNGEWAQKITITFGRGNGEYINTDTSAARYQWKRGNKWNDICTPSSGDNCTIQITEEMNETIYFRMIDTEGNISKVSNAYVFKIDTTPPKGEVIITAATMGNNDYYKSAEVILGTQNITDVVGTDPDAVSGIKYYTIVMSEIPTRSGSNGTTTGTQTADGNSITWYIFVEDNAENSGIYSITFKKDSTPPTAIWNPSSEGPHEESGGINYTGTCQDATSGVYVGETYTASLSGHINSPTSSSGQNVEIKCKDNAGNTATLTKNYKVKHYYSQNESKCGCASWNTAERCEICTKTTTSSKCYMGSAGCQRNCGGYCEAVGGTCKVECIETSTSTYSCNCYTYNTSCRTAASCWSY